MSVNNTAVSASQVPSGPKWSPFYWLRLTYHWTLKWSEHHFSVPALCLLGFVESIFFPVPTDVLLLTMGAAKPKRALYYAFLASIFSVAGGCFGYLLGMWAWNVVGDFFFQYVFNQELFNKVGNLYEEGAFLAVFSAAFTPIPFKVFAVAAGVFQISFLPFFLGAVIGRPLRFLIVGGLLYFAGAQVRSLVEKHFEVLTVVFTILLVGGFVLIKWVM